MAKQPPILFLDFDEVFLFTRAKMATSDILDPVSAGMIARVCRETGARIVVSSTWRSSHADCVDVLTRAGLIGFLWSPIVLPDDPSYDPSVNDDWRTEGQNNSRGTAVANWLADHPDVDVWAIMDDGLHDFDQVQLGRLVHTDVMFGLGIADYRRAVRLLGGVPAVGANRTDDGPYQPPRRTIAHLAAMALTALDQGDDDAARALLAVIRDEPLAR